MRLLSRHKPVLRFALFFALVLLPVGAGEAYVRSLPNAAKAKHAFLTAHSKEVDVLVLGSSHTYYGIEPQLLSAHAYSAAMVSQTLRYDDYLLHHYAFPRLRCVIVPVSDFTLYEELEGTASWYLANRYRLYMNCDVHPRLSVYDWECTAFPAFCEKLKSLWQAPKMHWSAYGQGLEYTYEARKADWDNGTVRAAANIYTDFSGATENMRHLQSIADFCKSHGARLVLVSTPLSATYYDALSTPQEADKTQRLKAFLRKNACAEYHDMRRHPGITEADFYDADHLNTRGAHAFTLLLRQAAKL